MEQPFGSHYHDAHRVRVQQGISRRERELSPAHFTCSRTLAGHCSSSVCGSGYSLACSAALATALAALIPTVIAGVALVLIGVLFVEARARFGEDAEVVIRELQIIFGVDAVALALRIGRERLVLFEQLGGVTARAIVDAIAVAVIGVTATLALSTTAATATGLTIIIDQSPVVLVYKTNPALLHQRMQTPRAFRVDPEAESLS